MTLTILVDDRILRFNLRIRRGGRSEEEEEVVEEGNGCYDSRFGVMYIEPLDPREALRGMLGSVSTVYFCAAVRLCANYVKRGDYSNEAICHVKRAVRVAPSNARVCPRPLACRGYASNTHS